MRELFRRILGNQCQICHFPIAASSLHSSSCSHSNLWCDHCAQLLKPLPRCCRCGLAKSPQNKSSVCKQSICKQCLANPPLWSRLYCVGDYDFPLAESVQQLKDRGQPWASKPLCQQLAQIIQTQTNNNPAELLLPVPLHWRRYLSRGFNQSSLISDYLGQYLARPVDHQLLQRNRHTPPQRFAHKNQRQHNLQHAFSLQKIPIQKHVAIVDDVVTTGSTVQHLTQLLLNAGVEQVDIYCLCRTPTP